MQKENFLQSFKLIEKMLLESELFNAVKSAHFEQQIYASILTEFAKLSFQSAFTLQELELKSQESFLNQEKIKSEIEMALFNFSLENRYKQAETLKSVVQSKSMCRSVGDNASINKSNAYTSVLNVVGNSQEQSAITDHIVEVKKALNNIDTRPLTEFDSLIDALKIELANVPRGTYDFFLSVHAYEISLGESVFVKIFSLYKHSLLFINNELVGENLKEYNFTPATIGEYTLTLRVSSDTKNWEEKSVNIKVLQGLLNTTNFNARKS